MIDLFVERWYIWLLIFMIVVFFIIKSVIKTYNNAQSNSAILAKLDSARYKVINNLILNVNGEVFQIHYAIVSNYGIFVLETRSYNGWITGGENEEYWTQILYSQREKLDNPILKNEKYIQALKNLPGLSEVKYIPIVVFRADCELKVSTDADVIYTADLLRTIRKYTDETITDEQKEAIYDSLSAMHTQIGSSPHTSLRTSPSREKR